MAGDAVLVVLIEEALNADRPARRFAAELLLEAIRVQQASHRWALKPLLHSTNPDVLAEIDSLVHTLGISRPEYLCHRGLEPS